MRTLEVEGGHALKGAVVAPPDKSITHRALFFAALGVKGLRTLRNVVLGQPSAQGISDLTESTNIAALNRLMLGVLAGERSLLQRADLPLGTSILAIARRR